MQYRLHKHSGIFLVLALSPEMRALQWKSVCSTLLVAMCGTMLLGNEEAKAVRESRSLICCEH